MYGVVVQSQYYNWTHPLTEACDDITESHNLHIP